MNTKLFDAKVIKEEFPIFQKRKNFIYLDSAATTQKPKSVIDALTDFYTNNYATVHRAIYELSMEATDQYDAAREKVQQFLNAKSMDEIVFTRGTTDAINLVRNSFGKAFLQKGDEIIISEGEHHSNMVPWQMLAEEKGLTLRIIPLSKDAEIMMDAFEELLSEKTKLVSIAHVFNATGTINPAREIVQKAHAKGAYVLIDGAQAAAHIPVDVQEIGADFYAFSGHKIYGPTGVGILYGKKEILDAMPPHQGGGDMIEQVTLEKSTYQKAPLRFEAGTPMIAEVIGLHAALEFIEEIGIDLIKREEEELLQMATEGMQKIPGLRIIGNSSFKTGIISFDVDGIHPLDIGTFLDLKGIAIRTGHHCAQPLLRRFGLSASARVSFGAYNTREDVEVFIESLKEVIDHLK